MYEWMTTDTLTPSAAWTEPKLEDVLNDLQREGWEIFTLLVFKKAQYESIKVVARKQRISQI